MLRLKTRFKLSLLFPGGFKPVLPPITSQMATQTEADPIELMGVPSELIETSSEVGGHVFEATTPAVQHLQNAVFGLGMAGVISAGVASLAVMLYWWVVPPLGTPPGLAGPGRSQRLRRFLFPVFYHGVFSVGVFLGTFIVTFPVVYFVGYHPWGLTPGSVGELFRGVWSFVSFWSSHLRGGSALLEEVRQVLNGLARSLPPPGPGDWAVFFLFARWPRFVKFALVGGSLVVGLEYLGSQVPPPPYFEEAVRLAIQKVYLAERVFAHQLDQLALFRAYPPYPVDSIEYKYIDNYLEKAVTFADYYLKIAHLELGSLENARNTLGEKGFLPGHPPRVTLFDRGYSQGVRLVSLVRGT